MIAKIVVHADNRSNSLDALVRAVEATEIAGSVTNAAFLSSLGRDSDFAAGDVDTGLIARKQDQLTRTEPPDPSIIAQAALVASGISNRRVSNDPWDSIAGYGHFHPAKRQVALGLDGETISARIGLTSNGKAAVETPGAAEITISPHVDAALWPGHVTVFSGGRAHTFSVADPFAMAAEAEGSSSSMRAPMPGLAKMVMAAKGDAVVKGQALLILEAMKMEHTIAASHDGVIDDIVAEGAQVTDGTVLVRFLEEA
jgi:3-methylcrotonyl-CoA carboxylase alpha subunit